MRSVFVIGDSISIQYGPYLRSMLDVSYDRMSGEEQALVDLDKPTGANGGDSSRVLSYLLKEKENGVTYDILLLNCGLHDIKTEIGSGSIQVPIDLYRENLQRVAELAPQIANDFVWIRTTDAVEHIHNTPRKPFHRFHADVLKYNEAADQIFSSAKIPILDLYGFTRTFGEDAFGDEVHYKQEIRKLQAAFIAGYLDARFFNASR